MATVSADLPARNVWPSYSVDLPLSTRIGGTDCLAVAGDGQGVLLDASQAGFLVGSLESPVHPGYAQGSGDALGFGLFDLPGNATLVDCRFVATMQVSGTGVVLDGTAPDGWFSPTPTEFPTLTSDFSGMAPSGGFTLTVNQPVGAPINHFIDGADYVIAGIGEPDTGTFGLCPHFTSIDWATDWFMPGFVDYQVFVDYLAIRVTYQLPDTGAPPRRKHPRDDDRGVGHGRTFPPPRSQQKSKRRGGGYV